MSPAEWITKIVQLGKEIPDKNILLLASTGTMAEMSERIWGEGKLTSGEKLTYDEDYEVYAYKPPSPVKPSGKGKTGKSIKGGWYPSYLAYKEQQSGRDKNPFELTGDMRLSWAGGAIPKPRVVDPLLCEIVMDQAQAEKAVMLEKRKGEFLELTKEERESHTRRINDLFREILQAA
jgi:hypothetical protein